MNPNDLDDLGLDTDRYPKPKRKKPAPPAELGKLHAILVEGLPDYLDENGGLNVRKVSAKIGISFQAMYKWFDREQISAKRIKAIVQLSENTQNRPKPKLVNGKKVSWQPLQHDDFWEFMAG